MNANNKNYIIGFSNLISKIQGYSLKNLLFLYKIFKDISIFALIHLKEIIILLFNKQNRKTTLTLFLLSIILINLFRLIKYYLKILRKSKLEKVKVISINTSSNLKPKSNQISIECDSKKINDAELKTNKMIVFNNIVKENKRDVELITKLEKIKKCVETQNKIRVKNNLPKENLNTPFYNILNLYINDILKKN